MGQAIMVSKKMNDLVWLPTQKLSVENLSSFIFLHMYVCIICTPTGVLWELKLCYCLPYGTLIVPLNILTLPPWGVPCRSPLVHFNYSSVYMHTLYPPPYTHHHHHHHRSTDGIKIYAIGTYMVPLAVLVLPLLGGGLVGPQWYTLISSQIPDT